MKGAHVRVERKLPLYPKRGNRIGIISGRCRYFIPIRQRRFRPELFPKSVEIDTLGGQADQQEMLAVGIPEQYGFEDSIKRNRCRAREFLSRADSFGMGDNSVVNAESRQMFRRW